MQGYAMDSGGLANQVRQAADGCYPFGFINEIKQLLKLAWPTSTLSFTCSMEFPSSTDHTSLSILFHYLIQPISLMFCGHLGKTELASAAMAISVIYITCVSVGRGLAFGGDTFFSQTYGSANKKRMGVYLQKGLIFGVLCACIVWAVLINTETLLLLLGQDPIVASMAQEYTQLFMPGALAYCWIFTLMRYLLCQNSVIPNLIICVASCGVNAVLHYCLVFQANMGFRGSAVSLMLTYYLVLFLLVAYIWSSGMYHETWDGWTWECLEDWGPFARVSISSIFMTFIFWLCTEVGTILAGLLGDEQISAFSICFQVEGFAWMIPLGIGGACTARVGQYLGANQPLGALTTCRVALTIQVFISLAMGSACYFLRYYIPMAFTSNRELIVYTAQIMPLVAIFLLLEGVSGVGVSIVRGTGRQTLGAVIIFISFYCFALPVGIPLMFVTKLELAGIWWGYVLGLVIQNLFLLVFIARLNWQNEANMAQIRAGVSFPSVTINQTINEENADDEAHSVEADERTGLIHAHSSSNYSSSASDTVILPRQRSVGRLILLRLVVLLCVLAVLGAGVGVRLFVRVPVSRPWSSLCLPTNMSDTEALLTFQDDWSVGSNVTLPPCNNETQYYSLPLSHFVASSYRRVFV